MLSSIQLNAILTTHLLHLSLLPMMSFLISFLTKRERQRSV